MEFCQLGHLDIAANLNRCMASEPPFESKMPKYFQNLHSNLKTMNSERKFTTKNMELWSLQGRLRTSGTVAAWFSE